MPAIRQSLRDRCKVQLHVKTAIPASDDDYYYYDDEINKRGRSRMRKYTDVCVPYNKASIKKSNAAQARLYPIDTPTTEGLHQLHRLVPYIYVGFYDAEHLPPSIVSDDGALFTHIVKITHASKTQKPGHCDLQVDIERGLCCLKLVVPGPCPESKAKENTAEGQSRKMVLTEEQLLLARDFLALALPYYAEAHPRDDIPWGSADIVRILIAAPAGEGAAADIMSIVACYLTFASEEPAETVVEYIKVEEDIPKVWTQGVEGREAVRLIAKIARFGE
ncbi:hypothetical protein FPV67DRAFT_995435 [Lyophyllum atratum]|nr:hypothetical protein FPV67DRAFT_995435 [Lyophyllum atratum]